MMLFRYLSVLFLVISTVLLVPFHEHLGWLFWSGGVASVLLSGKQYAKYILLLFASTGILALTHISTSIATSNFLIMGGLLSSALLVPHVVVRWMYKDTSTLRFSWRGTWTKKMLVYIGIALVLSYALLPWYLRDTLSYTNWSVDLGALKILKLFVGTNALGIWDELFFCNTLLAILRKWYPFWFANTSQAFLFTSFLYELGFRGWYGPLIIYYFAWIQGYIFYKTDNLAYVICIHLIVDAMLFLVLIHLHHPEILTIFLT